MFEAYDANRYSEGALGQLDGTDVRCGARAMNRAYDGTRRRGNVIEGRAAKGDCGASVNVHPKTRTRRFSGTVSGYRYYSPGLQRWINRDPIGERAGINLYGFVHSNPTLLYDADGRVPLPVIVGGGVVIVGGAGAYAGLCINRWACRRLRDYQLSQAEAEADASAPDGSNHQGQGATPGSDSDVLTHCIAGCELAKHPGPCGNGPRALDFLNEREGTDPASQIDRYNNEVGIGIGMGAFGSIDNTSCRQACLDALQKDFLQTLVNGVPGMVPPRR
jgi:RHS repeat-associated protein